MASLIDRILEGREILQRRPWPRTVVGAHLWRFVANELVQGRLSLLGLWGEPSMVHMAIMDEDTAEIAIVSLDCPDHSYTSIGRHHPPALRQERAINDLFGITAEGLPDPRPWLDHNNWGVRFPLSDRIDALSQAAPYRFLPATGDGLHQIAVGPVHAGIIEPGHFRFTASGETVVRLEQRLGYLHKGIEGLMAGADLERAAQLAGRVSGDSTVAYAFAFSKAAEAALGLVVPERAVFLRALMAELERLANHFGDIGAVCNDASFSLMHAHCGVLRERTLRAADACFGHRLMMDAVLPGGIARDLAADGVDHVTALLQDIRRSFPELIELYDNTASLQDRTASTGILRAELARQFGAGGYVGRASGRAFDARKIPGYRPYDQLAFDIPVLQSGDVNARVWVRIREIEQSLGLVEQILNTLPSGAVRTELGLTAGIREGLGMAEAFRGDVLAWVRLDDDRVARCHLRDPSWFQWPLLEAVIEGNIVADFPLCNKSFNCSYSGHDL